jgi:hypothetical protein
MGFNDDLVSGAETAWNDARQFRLSKGTKGQAPESYLASDMNSEAKSLGKRIGAEKFLAMEAWCKQLGITPNYGA